MNFRQRFYDSYYRSNYNLKVTNSYYHFKNIQKITYRKPEFNPYINLKSPRLNLNIHSYNSNLNNYMFARQNKIYKKTIDDIRNIVVKPKLNLYYKLREEKIKEYRRASKTLETKELKRENSRFHKRLKSSKSFLRLREMEQDYKLNHQKLLERTKKINKRFMILPPINSIMRKFESNASNKYMRTQGNDYLDKMKSTEPHFPIMKYNN
jgi:hypothetical protein